MNSINEDIDYFKYPILIVDDDKDLLYSFYKEFKDTFTIFTAETAKEGLEILEKENITLFLTDQRMPVMTGVDLLKIARNKYPQIIRMLITAYADIDVVIEAINEGKVYGYISKPWKHEEIVTNIKNGINMYYLIKERDRLYQEKLDVMKRLASANRLNAVISMAFGLADRINNYLVAPNLFLEEFSDKFKEFENHLTEKQKESLKNLYSPGASGLNKMVNLSHEITNMCMPPKYNFQRYEPQIIIDIANEAVENLKAEMKDKEIKIGKEIEGSPPSTYFDRNAIKKVLFHLIQNSIHAISEITKGVILIKVTGPIYRSGKEFIRIVVQDNGMGIQEDNIENVFNPFFTTKGTSGGVGLGLTTSQFIITQLDGDIEIAHTEPDKGTTMHIDLPVKKEPPKETIDYKDILGQFPAKRK